MVKPDDTLLEQRIEAFLTRYRPRFDQLILALGDARISHYSSGCGSKSIAFDIFPAAGYVEELLCMLSLDRPFKSKSAMGLQDTDPHMNRHPAGAFLLFLRRWGGFAEQVMRREGDSARGIAAARAKLLIDGMAADLGGGTAAKPSEFTRLMQAIGLALKTRVHGENECRDSRSRTSREHNYHKALAGALGDQRF